MWNWIGSPGNKLQYQEGVLSFFLRRLVLVGSTSPLVQRRGCQGSSGGGDTHVKSEENETRKGGEEGRGGILGVFLVYWRSRNCPCACSSKKRVFI